MYNRQGKYKEAEELYKKALDIRVRVLGGNHPATASSYNNLGVLYDEQGKYKEAEELYKKALTIRARTLGEDHPETAAIRNRILTMNR